MNQKTLIFVSCFVLAFVCLLCLGGFGFISYLMRNSTPSLPSSSNKACTLEAKICPDGSAVSRNGAKNCEFDDCPVAKACTDDAKLCSDGTSVVRDPSKNCQFDECPTTENKMCTQDIKVCPDGSYTSRDPANNCQFKSCIKPY